MMAAFDLLNKQAPIHIDDGRPVGLTEREVKSAKDTCDFLKDVYGNRQVRKTQMNEGSSRSHTALILKAYFCDSKDGDYVSPSFTLFDLAGAERTSKTGGAFMSPQDAMAALYKGKDVGAGGEGAIINWDLSSMMDQIQKATECAKAKRQYKCGTAMMTPAMQTICSCFDGRALMGLIVCVSQSQQHGQETWFSCQMGQRLAALKSIVKPRQMGKIEKIITDRQKKLETCKKSLKDKPTHKLAPSWKAQIQGLELELATLDELKVYDPSKDKVSVFVRKQLGLFANTEDKSDEEKEQAVRECFERADTNGDRFICLGEFKAIFEKLPNCQMTPEHVEGLWKQMDVNGDKKISFDEFFNYMFKK